MKSVIRAQSAPWKQGVEFYIGDRDGLVSVKEVVLWKHKPDEVFDMKPSFSLAPDSVQTLMDDLWNCGFRPTEGSGSSGSLAATERHLADMRAIVFKESPPPKNA